MALKPVHRSTGDAIADRRYAYATAAFVEADWQVAVDLAGQTLELTPDFAPAHVLLGRSQAALGRKDEAVAALSEALRLDPEDELGARIDLSRLGALAADDAIGEGYVRALFDSYAEGFDAHLTGALAYRGPAVVMAGIAAACEKRGRKLAFRLAIDLGCGTGLMAREIGKRANRIEGVDISPKMIAVAARTGLYAALNTGEIVDELDRRAAESADLIVAADVLVYLGDLFPLFREAARVLPRGGLFAFTAQSHAGHGFQLGVDARFSHSEDYLRTVADDSGLDVAHLASVSTRQDRGFDVPGFVMVLTRI
ncbi:MAG: methyltransferase domain-containing protein [Hyphomicrobiales bacterium]|jgi:predicted TPR repeat methyltransferase|nr:methyltransferase domain-containing protein [Hyphomicrobiales bacterium]